VEVESPEVLRGCEEGVYEKIDPKLIGGKAAFLPGTVSECGVGIFVWSTAIAYNADKLKTGPTSWADFWDVKKFPGKRGLRKGAKYTLEFALLADGVKPARPAGRISGTSRNSQASAACARAPSTPWNSRCWLTA
jgi:putative spermidine/putrescine transport system substrate-binding protein